MTNLPTEIATLVAEGRFARFIKVDLHVHTPATPWCWNQHRSEGPAAGTLRPVDVANAIIASDVDLLAITDHDTVLWTESVIRETRRLAAKAGRQITVLPGVEVTTYDGVHLLAVFGEGTPVVDIADMLKTFELKADGVSSERASSNWPVDKVSSKIEQIGGLVIAPHANDRAMGIWGGDKSAHKGKRQAWMRDGVARILACAPEQIDGLKGAIKHSGVDRRFAFIRHSDAHDFSAIGKQATFIKLAERSIDGLRQVIHEPELRVAFTSPVPPTYPRILGMEIDGGYFQQERIAFSDHLNTLIGGNYSGKSAVIDALRFVFDDACFGDAAERDRLLIRIDGIVQNGTIRVWFVGADRSYYRAERRALIHREKRSQGERITCSIDTVVTRLDGDVELPVATPTHQLLPIDFYAQGSVNRVAQFADRHRELIDAMAGNTRTVDDLNPTAESKSRVLTPAFENATAIETGMNQLEQIDEQLARIPGLNDQLSKLEAQAKSHLHKEWSEWQDAAQHVRALEEGLTSLELPADANEMADRLLSGLPDVPNVATTVDAALEPIQSALDKLRANVRAAATPLVATMNQGVDACSDAVSHWNALLRTKRDEVHAALQELKLTSEQALITRISELKQQISKLEQRKTERDKLVRKLDDLERERTALIRHLHDEWDRIRDARRLVVAALNAATGSEISVTCEAKTDRAILGARLHALMREHGSKDSMVKKRDQQIAQIVEVHDAESLVALLRVENVADLVSSAKVTANTAQFLCNLPLSDRLALATCIADDRIEITYRRPDEATFTELERLSPGERAVVLLTVAFAGGGGPLIIDQPEDELGQALVTADIVDTIRRRKTERQFIVVTHNANIPVLGDAEGVYSMLNSLDPTTKVRRCSVQHTGAIECDPIKTALLGLEGGRESFLKRQERYQIEEA